MTMSQEFDFYILYFSLIFKIDHHSLYYKLIFPYAIFYHFCFQLIQQLYIHNQNLFTISKLVIVLRWALSITIIFLGFNFSNLLKNLKLHWASFCQLYLYSLIVLKIIWYYSLYSTHHFQLSFWPHFLYILNIFKHFH
jgi:hypothetical protein